MKHSITRRGALALGLVTAATLTLTSAPSLGADGHGDPSPAQVAARKQSLDARHANGVYGPRPQHSAGWNARQTARFAAAEQLVAGQSITTAPLLRGNDVSDARFGGSMTALPSRAGLLMNQQAQITSYFCGPAAVKELLGQVGLSSRQTGLANALGTTTNGTAWSGVYVSTQPSTGYPIPDVLNYRLRGRAYYAPVNVSYSPTAAEMANYRVRLMSDIATGWPLIGNAYEVPGGPHLTGHPQNATIFHYFNIRGYSNNGAVTQYEDSVHGASSISWSPQVPAYSNLPSNTIASIVGGRGYIW